MSDLHAQQLASIDENIVINAITNNQDIAEEVQRKFLHDVPLEKHQKINLLARNHKVQNFILQKISRDQQIMDLYRAVHKYTSSLNDLRTHQPTTDQEKLIIMQRRRALALESKESSSQIASRATEIMLKELLAASSPHSLLSVSLHSSY